MMSKLLSIIKVHGNTTTPPPSLTLWWIIKEATPYGMASNT